MNRTIKMLGLMSAKTSGKTAALAVMAAMGLASMAAPSFAFDRYGQTYYNNNEMRMDMRIRNLETQYNSGLRKGGFDRNEQRYFRSQIDSLSRQGDQFERSGRGVDDRELAAIVNRSTRLWHDMSVAAHDNDRDRRNDRRY